MKIKIQYILTMSALSLTLSYGTFAQTTTQSQKFGANPTLIAPSAVLEIESTNKGVLFPRVTLSSTSDVTTIASPATGLTVFNTASAGTSPNNVTPGYYYWSGSKWVKIAIETPPVDFAKTVYVNATSPSSATIFDENNPPATNDNALKSDDANLFIGTDGSTWTFDTSTSTYKTFNAFTSNPFNLANSNTDAGGNKTLAIWRTGSIGIGINNPLTTLHVQNPLAATNTVNANAQVLRLSRPATSGVKEDNFAQFNLGSYENTGTSSFQARTRLDLALKDGTGTASTNVMTWNANGRVGILNTAPTASMDVISSLGATATVNADVPMLKLTRPTFNGKWGGVAQFSLGSYGTGAVAQTRLDMGLNDGGDLTTLNTVMTMQANGNIGLGITSPIQRLDVNGTGLFRRGNSTGASFNQILFGFNSGSNFQHAIKTRHAGGTAQGNAIDFYVWTNAVTDATVGTRHLMSLEGQGRVGIGGITNPTSVIDAASVQVATATINADRKMLRLSIPTNSGVKFENVAEFNMGSYAISGTNARTRLDLLLNDGLDNTVSRVMTWQANGNVGIGTAAPEGRLHVLFPTGGDQPIWERTNSGGGSVQAASGQYLLNNLGTTLASQPTNEIGTGFSFAFKSNTEAAKNVAAIVGGLTNYAAGTGTLSFRVNGATNGGIIAMRINSDGNVGIGTDNTAPTQRLQVVGNIAASGTVSASGTTLTSDARLKSNVVRIKNGLITIMQLNPVNYDKKIALDSAATANENGFIAQELQKIMPELVSEGNDEDKLLSINYTAIIPVLTKAVQEQQAIIEKQQMQINELKALLEKVLNDK